MNKLEFPIKKENEPLSQRHNNWIVSKINELQKKYPKLVSGILGSIVAAPMTVGFGAGAFAGGTAFAGEGAAYLGVLAGTAGGAITAPISYKIWDSLNKMGIEMPKMF
jgi:hypothetical protein